MKYKGETCSKCGTIFNEDDDVVVCPECGSPHHRDCYKLTNICANNERHSEGFKWTPSVPRKTDAHEPAAFCPFCNYKVSPDAEECPRCKKSLVESGTRNENGIVPNSFPRLFGIEHDKKINGANAWELVYFVSRNPIYFIPLFNHFAETGKKISFNLCCFIFPPVYFAYRRMWGWAVFTAVISVLLSLPITLAYFADAALRDNVYTVFSQPVLNMICDNSHILNAATEICNVLDFAVRMLLCLFGNRLYYNYATNSVKTLRQVKGSDLTVKELLHAGGVRLINVFLILLMTFMMTAAALTASQSILESVL